MQNNWIPRLLSAFAGILLFACSCSHRTPQANETFVVFLVDAPHLDTRSTPRLLKSLIKNPASREGGGFVGHAWFYAQGEDTNGKWRIVEGGHSGELGIKTPRYFDGIMNYIEFGVVNPTEWDKQNPTHEPNPIKYLWANLGDGFFQEGNGGHQPTFAAKIPISTQEFQNILFLLSHYPFENYNLHEYQCVTLIVAIAKLLNMNLKYQHTLAIPSELKLQNGTLPFWENPLYSQLELASPDTLEHTLKQWVRERKMQNVTTWYLRKDLNSLSSKWLWHWNAFTRSWRQLYQTISFLLTPSPRSLLYSTIITKEDRVL